MQTPPLYSRNHEPHPSSMTKLHSLSPPCAHLHIAPPSSRPSPLLSSGNTVANIMRSIAYSYTLLLANHEVGYFPHPLHSPFLRDLGTALVYF